MKAKEVVLLPRDNEGIHCRTDLGFSIDECVTAAASVGGDLRGDRFLIGYWPNAPPGCFIEASDNAIHFNQNSNGFNDGYFQPVCVREES